MNARPFLSCDFKLMAQRGYLDPIFTFSRDSTATRINPQTGLMETVAASVPRLGKEGLLIEGPATNFIPKANFEGAVGSSPSWFSAPEGGMVLTDELPQFCGANVAKHRQIGDGVCYCDSTGQAGANVFAVDLWIPSGQDVSSIILNAEWAASDVTILSAVDLDKRDCWQRAAIKFNRTSSENSVATSLRSTGGGYYYSRAWQVEAGSVPTSYIPTSSGAAYRDAEFFLIDGLTATAWFKRERGTLIIDADSRPSTENIGVVQLVASGGGLWDNSINIENNAAGMWDFSVCADAVSLTRASILPTTQALKMAASWESGAWSVFANGAKIEIQNAAPIPPLDQLWLGSWRNWNNGGSSRIRSLQILPWDTPDVVLKAMSALE
jgi:hypothetical protein